MSTKFFTNKDENTLLNKFQIVFSNNLHINLSALANINL
jgi:hypothetical protein